MCFGVRDAIAKVLRAGAASADRPGRAGPQRGRARPAGGPRHPSPAQVAEVDHASRGITAARRLRPAPRCGARTRPAHLDATCPIVRARTGRGGARGRRLPPGHRRHAEPREVRGLTEDPTRSTSSRTRRTVERLKPRWRFGRRRADDAADRTACGTWRGSFDAGSPCRRCGWRRRCACRRGCARRPRRLSPRRATSSWSSAAPGATTRASCARPAAATANASSWSRRTRPAAGVVRGRSGAGLTAGTSTPDDVIDEVELAIRDIAESRHLLIA